MNAPTPLGMFVPLTVKRYAAGSYADATGLYVAGAESTFTIQASFQRMSAREVFDFDGGERNRSIARIYTSTPLREANAETGTAADRVVAPAAYGGGEYIVKRCDPWVMGTLDHFKCVAVKDIPDGD